MTAVVLNWRTADHTARAAAALVSDGLPEERLVIIDNGSGDDGPVRLQRAFPRAHVIELRENVGYGRGMNIGARALPAAAYLLVNSDAFLHRPGSLDRMASAAIEYDAGIVVPRILNPDLSLQRTVSPLRRPVTALVRAAGGGRFVPDRHQPRMSVFWDHGASRYIEYAAFPTALVRSDVWDALAGFDEEIPMYAEDLDLCWRARDVSARVWFCAEAEFVHIGNASGGSRWTERRRWELMSRAESEVIRRRLPRASAELTLAITAVGLLPRIAYRSLRGDRLERARLIGWLRGSLPAPRRGRSSDV